MHKQNLSLKSKKKLPFGKILYEKKINFMGSAFNNFTHPQLLIEPGKKTSIEMNSTIIYLRNLVNFKLAFPKFEGFERYPVYSFAKERGMTRGTYVFIIILYILLDQLSKAKIKSLNKWPKVFSYSFFLDRNVSVQKSIDSFVCSFMDQLFPWPTLPASYSIIAHQVKINISSFEPFDPDFWITMLAPH